VAAGTEARATWVRSGKDSVGITLHRIGMVGTVALGPDAGGRAGTASSGVVTTNLEEVRVDAPTRARAKSVAPSPAPNAEPARSERRVPAAAPLQVTLRSIACPTR
jgi:hypothetical protein